MNRIVDLLSCSSYIFTSIFFWLSSSIRGDLRCLGVMKALGKIATTAWVGVFLVRRLLKLSLKRKTHVDLSNTFVLQNFLHSHSQFHQDSILGKLWWSTCCVAKAEIQTAARSAKLHLLAPIISVMWWINKVCLELGRSLRTVWGEIFGLPEVLLMWYDTKKQLVLCLECKSHRNERFPMFRSRREFSCRPLDLDIFTLFFPFQSTALGNSPSHPLSWSLTCGSPLWQRWYPHSLVKTNLNAVAILRTTQDEETSRTWCL